MRRSLIAAAAALLLALPVAPAAMAASQGVLAVVNDVPVTDRDLSARVALLKFLGDLPPQGMSRKEALKSIVDEQIKIAEANRMKMMPTDAEVTDRIATIAKEMKLDSAGLFAKLKAQGVGEKAFRSYMGASIGFSRIIATKYQASITVKDADVDAKMAEIKSKAGTEMARIMNDPRMKPVTVYKLMIIGLPVESEDPMLLQSRAIEAQQLIRNFKGCGSVKSAASGIFNVKIGKTVEADAAKLPPQMRQALDKAGAGKAVGPARNKAGLEIIAFCGSRTVTPPKPDFKMPTREQVQRSLVNKKYSGYEEEYLSTLRDKIYVEYRDKSIALQ